MTAATNNWPKSIWLVRHGQSAGNVARDSAERDGAHVIAIAGRDVDVPLSELGERQARALGRWMAQRPEALPSVILSSPYLRARQSAELVIAESGLAAKTSCVVDERLREKEFGSLNRLTKAGIAATFPDEARRYAEIGKFYYRPPGGESWCDVIVRLRSVLHDMQLRYAGERVLVLAHQVVVLCFRYLLEDMDEATILTIDREKDVANCGLTSFELGQSRDGRTQLLLDTYNFVSPLAEAGEPVTTKPDAGTGSHA